MGFSNKGSHTARQIKILAIGKLAYQRKRLIIVNVPTPTYFAFWGVSQPTFCVNCLKRAGFGGRNYFTQSRGIIISRLEPPSCLRFISGPITISLRFNDVKYQFQKADKARLIITHYSLRRKANDRKMAKPEKNQ